MPVRATMLIAMLAAIAGPVRALPPVVDNSLYPGAAGPANTVISATPSNTAMLELVSRLELLQAEVRQLTGKIEEQAHQLAELKKQQKTLTADFDQRLSELENSANAAAVDQTPADSLPPAAAMAEGEPKEVSAPEPEVAAAARPAAPPAPAAVPEAEKRAYEAAYDTFRRGRTDEAMAAFQAFMGQYPDSALAGNAQYWIGEGHRVKRDNVAAQRAFHEVISKYPNASKVPDALFRLGDLALEQNQPEVARDYLNKLVTAHPNTRPAIFAERKLATLNAN